MKNAEKIVFDCCRLWILSYDWYYVQMLVKRKQKVDLCKRNKKAISYLDKLKSKHAGYIVKIIVIYRNVGSLYEINVI